jgi:hypothetical protein
MLKGTFQTTVNGREEFVRQSRMRSDGSRRCRDAERIFFAVESMASTAQAAFE